MNMAVNSPLPKREGLGVRAMTASTKLLTLFSLAGGEETDQGL